jgi:hypothetical protein
MARNYKQEASYEDTPKQIKRRESRNRVRAKAEKAGKVHKGDNKELDHIGYHLNGTLANVPARVVSKHANLVRQPPHKAKK